MATALAAALAAAQACQGVEQIAPAMPPAASVATEQAHGAGASDVTVAQLPPEPRAVTQPLPSRPKMATYAVDATVAYSAILGPSSVRQPGDAPPELGPVTVANFVAIVAATAAPKPLDGDPKPSSPALPKGKP